MGILQAIMDGYNQRYVAQIQEERAVETGLKKPLKRPTMKPLKHQPNYPYIVDDGAV